jgi:hypothetical protein
VDEAAAQAERGDVIQVVEHKTRNAARASTQIPPPARSAPAGRARR